LGTTKNIDLHSASKVQNRRKEPPSTESLIQGILRGDKTSLAQGITLIESSKKEDLQRANTIIESCLSEKKESARIGITGVPGVGKSTFIEALGTTLTGIGEKVAVLAVDPTSTISKGSILGDKTRMQELVKDPNAFIRPSPSGESLGGVARRTRESIILCEAAGYNIILIETVGVGQSETAVHSMVDFFLLLKLAGAGDELQGIKRGIMEMADAIVINKADGENIKQAKQAKSEFTRALHLYPPKRNGWIPKVITCSALEKEGITQTWKMIDGYLSENIKSGHFKDQRQEQSKYWLLQAVDDLLKNQFYKASSVKKQLKQLLQRVKENKISPFRAAEKLLEHYQQNK